VIAGKRIYLRLGDTVVHASYEEWGEGVVVEEMTSSVPGGTCLVRILFDDGQQRTFNNDLDNDLCCYYFGLRKGLRTDRGSYTVGRRRARRLPRG
jgi:hypothetical protein